VYFVRPIEISQPPFAWIYYLQGLPVHLHTHVDSCSGVIRTIMLVYVTSKLDGWTSVAGRLGDHEATPGGGHGRICRAGSELRVP